MANKKKLVRDKKSIIGISMKNEYQTALRKYSKVTGIPYSNIVEEAVVGKLKAEGQLV